MDKSAHAEGKAAISAAIIEKWKELAKAARAADNEELAKAAEEQAALREKQIASRRS